MCFKLFLRFVVSYVPISFIYDFFLLPIDDFFIWHHCVHLPIPLAICKCIPPLHKEAMKTLTSSIISHTNTRTLRRSISMSVMRLLHLSALEFDSVYITIDSDKCEIAHCFHFISPGNQISSAIFMLPTSCVCMDLYYVKSISIAWFKVKYALLYHLKIRTYTLPLLHFVCKANFII